MLSAKSTNAIGAPVASVRPRATAGVGLPWRVGRHYGIHVYEGDRPVATFHDPEEAALAVAAVNAMRASRG